MNGVDCRRGLFLQYTCRSSLIFWINCAVLWSAVLKQKFDLFSYQIEFVCSVVSVPSSWYCVHGSHWTLCLLPPSIPLIFFHLFYPQRVVVWQVLILLAWETFIAPTLHWAMQCSLNSNNFYMGGFIKGRQVLVKMVNLYSILKCANKID